MKKLFVILFLIVIGGCLSLPKEEANYKIKYVYKQNDSRVIYDTLKKQLPITIKKHNFTYTGNEESWVDKKYKNPKENVIDKIEVDDSKQIITAWSYIFVKYSVVPIKTYFQIYISINENNLIVSFNEINTLNEIYSNKIQLDKFKEQAVKFNDELLSKLITDKKIEEIK